MSTFPTSPDEFYALRDDRTSRCCDRATYQTASCAVAISRVAAATAAGQMMAVASANLLSRWCRRVTIVLPKAGALPALHQGKGDLPELILAQMKDADPFGDFEVREDGPGDAEFILAIGSDAGAGARPTTIFINASGWLAAISRRGPVNLPPASDFNLLGAIAAACLGVAQLFKLALRMPSTQLPGHGVFDLFNLGWSADERQEPWPDGQSIGNILMVGAGSVGSAAAYCLRTTGLRGAMSVVDRDVVKIENFNRSPVFGHEVFGLGKATAVAQFLSGSNLATTAVPVWWNDFLGGRPRSSFDFDVWLPLANEFNVRQVMQHNVPPLMIHASTTRNWGVNHARHIPGRDDCLADRFPSEGVTAEQLTCSTAPIQMAEREVDAALPFASMFAGLLVAADLVRALLPGYPQVPNFALLDWYGPLDAIQLADRRPRPGCPFCRDQSRSFHDRFNGGTRYRHLFRL